MTGTWESRKALATRTFPMRKCECCQIVYQPKTRDQKYHNRACMIARNKPRVTNT